MVLVFSEIQLVPHSAPLERFLKSVYFWPGTQSLGLTTEDLFWTGNEKRKLKLTVDKISPAKAEGFQKQKRLGSLT
jgi:hypothetical protein